jgi:hypothetical protein
MSKLKEDAFDTPTWAQKVFGKTVQYGEIIAVVVVVLILANMLGLGG